MTFLEHFGFIEQPFGVTPDPRFLHLGPKHREALASLVHATEENRGFVALIAPPGMGKTTLLFQYLESFRHKARTVFLFQGARNPSDLMHYLLTELGVATPVKDLPQSHETLNTALLEDMRAGRHFILVIDEAQNLGPEVLESVRLLSNFETPWMKLMLIVLAGQPELAENLSRRSMAQLRQRISSFIRLEPFTPEETNAYINHRLWVAGYAGSNLFTVGARGLIAEHSGGIPRNISNLCYQSLALAHATEKTQVRAEIVREVISELAIESAVPAGALPPMAGPTPVSNFTGGSQMPGALGSLAPAGRRVSPAIVSVSALLFLSIVSGVLWRATLNPKPLGVTPSVEAAAFPMRSVALVPAPEAMHSVSANSRVTKSVRSDAPTTKKVTSYEAASRRVFILVVAKGTTLRHISLQYLGQFDPRVCAEILSLNPEIRDPDHIEAGQHITLPLSLRRDAALVSAAGEASPSVEGAR